jgi:methyl-CpG-binding domain protein 2
LHIKLTFLFSSRGVRADASLVPPIRQTASIFKQPVSIYKTQNEGSVKTELKHGTEFGSIELPKGLKPVGPFVDQATLLQSVATSLHVSFSSSF